MYRILVINPGSTSTKLAIYEDERELCSRRLEHTAEELRPFPAIYDQYEFRLALVRDFLRESGVEERTLSAVVSRGGLVRPIPCGTYLVNERMLRDLRAEYEGRHVSNLAPALARGIADPLGISAFIVDPITSDELEPVARITGMPGMLRKSRLHTLNQKAVGRKAAAAMGGRYEDFNFVICHLGTGTSVAAHRRGRVVDMCDAGGEGPMSCDRCGGLNNFSVMEMARACSEEEWETLVHRMYTQGGIYAHLGTKDIREVRRRIAQGDKRAELVLNAMIYQVGKEIGAQAAALSGQVDKILITGGIAHDRQTMEQLTAMVKFIAPVELWPGEEEMEALAMGALRVLRGEEPAKEYAPRDMTEQLIWKGAWE